MDIREQRRLEKLYNEAIDRLAARGVHGALAKATAALEAQGRPVDVDSTTPRARLHEIFRAFSALVGGE